MIKLKDLLNEAYGAMKVGADLESWAKRKGVNFKKVSAKKSAAAHGVSISDTFYQIGDKFALVRYETVPGAGRLNQLKFYLIDKPDTSAKIFDKHEYVEDFYGIQHSLDKADLQGGKEVTNWNKTKVEKFVKDLGKDRKYNKFSGNQAFDMAKQILRDTKGLENAIKTNYRVTDAAEWLADKM